MWLTDLFDYFKSKPKLVKEDDKMFKIGDKVIAIKKGSFEFTYTVGDQGVVTEAGVYESWISVTFDNGNKIAGANSKNFELIKEDKNMFTKEDIKPGMILETRGGQKLIKFSKCFMPRLDNPFYGINLSYYFEDLTCSTGGNASDDIVKVYRTKLIHEVLAGNYESLEIVWSRTNTEVDSIKNNIKDMESKLVEMKENLKKLEDK